MRHVLAVCLALLAVPALAQTMPCGARAQVLDMLAQSEQTRRATGLVGDAVMETYANAATGAWTITISLRDGRMCLLANGQDFAAKDEVFPAAGRAI